MIGRRRGNAVAVALSVGLFPHCGDPSRSPPRSETAPAPRFERSGTRLEARGWEADGFFVFDTFFDRKLGLECVPGVASDKVRRCLPRNVLSKRKKMAGVSPLDYFEAPDCKGPRLIYSWKVEGGCTDPARIVARGFNLGADYERIGAPRTPSSKLHTFYSSSTCGEATASPAHDFFAPGAAIAAADLVAFTVKEVDVAPAVRSLVLEGEDGSRFPLGDFVNVARGKPCRLGLAADDTQRCVPIAGFHQSAGAFVDEACTSHAAIPLDESPGIPACTSGPCDDTAVTVGEWPSDRDPSCARKVGYHERGPERPIVRYSGAGSPACQPASPETVESFRSYAIGEEIDPKTLPEATNGRVTHARLEEHTIVVGGVSVQRVSLVDPALGEECTFATAADGKQRCLPANAVLAQPRNYDGTPEPLYEDERCMQPLYFRPRGEYVPGGERRDCGREPRYARVVEGPTCAPVVRIYNVRPATVAFRNYPAGQCVPGPDVLAGGLKGTVFALVDEVPATTFAEGTAVTR